MHLFFYICIIQPETLLGHHAAIRQRQLIRCVFSVGSHMCNGTLGLLRQIIAYPTRCLDQLDSSTNRLNSPLPNTMHLFKVIIWYIPEHDAVKYIRSITPFLENNEHELCRRQIVIEFRFFPSLFLAQRNKVKCGEGHAFLDLTVALHSDSFGDNTCLLKLLRTGNAAFDIQHSRQ